VKLKHLDIILGLLNVVALVLVFWHVPLRWPAWLLLIFPLAVVIGIHSAIFKFGKKAGFATLVTASALGVSAIYVGLIFLIVRGPEANEGQGILLLPTLLIYMIATVAAAIGLRRRFSSEAVDDQSNGTA